MTPEKKAALKLSAQLILTAAVQAAAVQLFLEIQKHLGLRK